MKKLLFISLTNKCNRECSYCPIKQYKNNAKYPDNMPLGDLAMFIYKAKPDYIELTGGEPTLYSHYNELCDFLDDNGFKYLTKSNGDFKGRNQISAWHTDFPKYYDQILIIKDTEDWDIKIEHCQEFKIPFKVIGKDNNLYQGKDTNILNIPSQKYETMFICPDGRIKRCHEIEILGYSEEKRYTIKDEPNWENACPWCKSVSDYMIFLKGE